MRGIERTLGIKYPISIGSAMVFENDHFNIREWPKLLYVNLRTLFRNYVASIPPNQYYLVKEDTLLIDYFNEVAEIERIIKEISNNTIQLMFYYPNYDKVTKILPKVTPKEYNPEMFDYLEQDLWKHVKEKQILVPFFYTEIGMELPKANEPTLVWTSFVTDLLSAGNFPILYLLESYTGKIKKRQEWYSKINLGQGKSSEGVKIPFNRFTMQIFGDKSGSFKGADRNLRMLVRQMAKQDGWTPVSTNDKIKFSIGKLKDFKLKELLYSYL